MDECEPINRRQGGKPGGLQSGFALHLVILALLFACTEQVVLLLSSLALQNGDAKSLSK